MDAVLRGATTYAFVWLTFRIAGKRTLADITTFDVLLLLIISEAVQGALVSNDNSMTHSFLLVLTMMGIDSVLSYVKRVSPLAGRVLDGAPVVLLDHNGLRQRAMAKERVDEDDILTAAREKQGLWKLDQIDMAVLEESGGISIIPKPS